MGSTFLWRKFGESTEPKEVAKYRIVVSRRVYKFLDKLDGKLRQRIIEEVSGLENFPFFIKALDIAKLKGRKGYY